MSKTVQPPPEFFGRTIFAEDIRIEKAGQFTIVGMFPGGVEVEACPAILPRMALLVEFQWRLGALKEPAKLVAFMPGDPLDEPIWQVEVAPPDPESQTIEKLILAEEQGPYPGELVSRSTSIVNMANIKISSAGMLQVRAFVGDKVFAIGGLSFSSKTENGEPASAS